MESYERHFAPILCDNRICYGSPREVLKQSFQANLITGDEWIEMLKVRNQLAHDYDGGIVKEHCQTIIHEYIDKLYDFKIAVETLLKVGM